MYSEEDLKNAKEFVLYGKRSKEFYEGIHSFWMYCLHERWTFEWFEPEHEDWFDYVYENSDYGESEYINQHSEYRSIRMTPKGVEYIMRTEVDQERVKILTHLLGGMCFENNGYRVGQALLDFIDGKDIDRKHLSFLKSRSVITGNSKSPTSLGLVIADRLPEVMKNSVTDWDW